jgi:hypothetical protein
MGPGIKGKIGREAKKNMNKMIKMDPESVYIYKKIDNIEQLNEDGFHLKYFGWERN